MTTSDTTFNVGLEDIDFIVNSDVGAAISMDGATGNISLGADLSLPNGTNINEFSTDGTLAGDSDDAVPTEKAVKTYVDNAVPSTGSFTMTLDSVTTTVTGTAYYSVDSNGVVTLSLPGLTGTSDANTGFNLSGLPAGIVPAQDSSEKYGCVWIQDDGVNLVGMLIINPSDNGNTIRIYKNEVSGSDVVPTLNAFGANTVRTLYPQTIQYKKA